MNFQQNKKKVDALKNRYNYLTKLLNEEVEENFGYAPDTKSFKDMLSERTKIYNILSENYGILME